MWRFKDKTIVSWKQIKQRNIVNQHVLKIWIKVKKIKAVEDKKISNYFEKKEKEKDYYQAEKLDKFYRDNFIRYKSRDDKNKTLSID